MMQLLVSASSIDDARAAVEGGAAIVDAKNPSAGPLGPVPIDVFQAIVATVAGRRPVTAALGDARDEPAIEALARDFAAAGASLVKVGFEGISNIRMVDALARATVRGAARGRSATGVVLVTYADASSDQVSPAALLEVASSAGAAGVLLDTADKGGPRLTELVAPAWLTEWVRLAHGRSLAVALAGRLRAEDLSWVAACGADVAGVRGAACDGGRNGRISPARVRELTRACAAAGEMVAQA
jgi:uncharacterized protein (UPF0264 family)